MQRIEAAEWEERHIGDAVAGKIIDQGIVLSMGYVVRVLHADDRDDPACFLDLRACDVAHPDVAHQTSSLEVGQHRERGLDRPLGGLMDGEHTAKIHHLEHVEGEIAQVVVDSSSQLFGRHRRDP